LESVVLTLAKKYAFRTIRALGFDIVRRYEINDRDFAAHLERLFLDLEIDCVLDVGANVGQYRDFLRDRVGYDGLIISFEPIARNIEILRQRSQLDKKWQIEGYALGSQSGIRHFNIMRSDVFSSFLEPDNSRVADFESLNGIDHVERVDVRTLDQVFPDLQKRLGFCRPYLKVDTQGYDIEVFRGARSILPSISALQTEASIIGIYKHMPNYIDTIRFLNERGFDVTALQPVNRDHLHRLVELDCVMRNSAVTTQTEVPLKATASQQI
jgi:FkbM family methyltransferase